MEHKKKQLTTTQKKNKYRALQYTTLGGEYVAIATPFGVMSIVNKDTWFPQDTGWKTGLGFTLACTLLFLIVSSISFETEKLNNRKGKYVKLLIGIVLSAFIFILLRDIMNEIANILWFAALGIASALGLEIFSAEFKAKADFYKDAISEARKGQAVEQAKEEINNNQVKW